MLGVAGARNWLMWLNFFNATSFGQTDPLFGRDVSFYVFRLPVWQSIQQQALRHAVLATRRLRPVLRAVRKLRHRAAHRRRVLSAHPARHAGAAAHRPAGRARLRPARLGHVVRRFPARCCRQPNRDSSARRYVDVHARLPILCAHDGRARRRRRACRSFYGFTRRGWPLPVAVALYLVVSFGGGIYSASVQRLIVVPDELNREQPYILNNIEATRQAYALDRVEEREVSPAMRS